MCTCHASLSSTAQACNAAVIHSASLSSTAVMQCIAMHHSALHTYNTLHALHCIPLQCITQHCTPLHYSTVHCIAIHCITQQCTGIQNNNIQYSELFALPLTTSRTPQLKNFTSTWECLCASAQTKAKSGMRACIHYNSQWFIQVQEMSLVVVAVYRFYKQNVQLSVLTFT